MFPVEEVCGSKGLVDEYLPSSLYLTMLVIMHWALDLPGSSAGRWESEDGRGLAETGWIPPIEWWVWGENWWT
jgi:hypothetical protein